MPEVQDNVYNLRNVNNVPSRHGETKVCVDVETGLYTLVHGTEEGNTFTIGAPTIQGILPVGLDGHQGQVISEGSLRVADFADGLPAYGLDAAGADTYVSLVTTAKRCRFLWVAVATQAAILSLNGGVSEHLWIPLGVSQLFVGLDIPAGSVIQGKNATAASNYANLTVAVW